MMCTYVDTHAMCVEIKKQCCSVNFLLLRLEGIWDLNSDLQACFTSVSMMSHLTLNVCIDSIMKGKNVELMWSPCFVFLCLQHKLSVVLKSETFLQMK